MADNTNIEIAEGFANEERIFKMIEEVAGGPGLGQKLKNIMIKHPPSGSPIDMNYLGADNESLDLEIVDSLDNLEGRVRHELMHVSDQLEESFKYSEDLIPKEGTGDFRRYKYLWNVYIDGRLERSGRPAYDTREGREKEIDECYPELSDGLRKKVFDFLWKLGPLNFEQITDMSRNLFSATEGLKSLADSYGEKLRMFETIDDLKNYR